MTTLSRVIKYTVLGYAACTGLTALSWDAWSLMFFRCLMGFFAGGEWAAGAALLTETWPTKHRGKIMGVMQCGWPAGTLLAAIVYAAIAPTWGWRLCFVTGIIPALLVLVVQFKLKETAHFEKMKAEGKKSNWREIFGPKYRKRTIMFILISFIGLLGNWNIMTWVPTILRTERGMGIVDASMWFIVIQIGCCLGYLLFGQITERLGRRITFTIFWLGCMVACPMFVLFSTTPVLMLIFGLLMGISIGYFVGYPLYGSELFPTHLRATGMGIAYTGIARMGSTFGPTAVGAAAGSIGISGAIAIMAGTYIIAVIVIWAMGYETKGKSVEELDAM